MNQDPCTFDARKRETVMVLATVRAVAAACDPATRLIGNIRCDDIIRAIDELIPLEEYYPATTLEIDPMKLYCRHDWRDGARADEVLMGLLTCAMNWEDDATIIGPLRAGEVAGAMYHALTGQCLKTSYDPDISSSPS